MNKQFQDNVKYALEHNLDGANDNMSNNDTMFLYYAGSALGELTEVGEAMRKNDGDALVTELGDVLFCMEAMTWLHNDLDTMKVWTPAKDGMSREDHLLHLSRCVADSFQEIRRTIFPRKGETVVDCHINPRLWSLMFKSGKSFSSLLDACNITVSEVYEKANEKFAGRKAKGYYEVTP